MICQSIGTSHQYLAKPCDIEQLKATIQRACALRDVLKSDSLRDLVAGMRTIPSMPALYMAIKKEAESTRSSLKVIEQIISKDMGMTAKLLQLANSAYFGLGRNVSTVGDAVGLIGLDTIQGLVLTIHVFAQFKHEKASRHFHVDRLWEESLAVGTLARSIARAEQRPVPEIEQAYTAGLLHDVGRLMLAANWGDRYDTLLTTPSVEDGTLWEAEQSEFGATHAEIGATLLGLWGLNDAIVEAVMHHHRPAACPGKTFAPLTAVHVADALLQEGFKREQDFCPALIDQPYLESLMLADRLSQWRDMAVAMEKEGAS